MSAIEKLDLEIECSEADFGMMGWRIYTGRNRALGPPKMTS